MLRRCFISPRLLCLRARVLFSTNERERGARTLTKARRCVSAGRGRVACRGDGRKAGALFDYTPGRVAPGCTDATGTRQSGQMEDGCWRKSGHWPDWYSRPVAAGQKQRIRLMGGSLSHGASCSLREQTGSLPLCFSCEFSAIKPFRCHQHIPRVPALVPADRIAFRVKANWRSLSCFFSF